MPKGYEEMVAKFMKDALSKQAAQKKELKKHIKEARKLFKIEDKKLARKIHDEKWTEWFRRVNGQ